MLDVVLRGGRILDGTGSPPMAGAIGWVGDRIVALEPDLPQGAMDVDVAGQVIAPGFIDTHTHSDALPQLDASHDDLRLGSVRQGVTTEIVGNCGFSLFPAPPEHRDAVQEHLATLFGPGVSVYRDVAAFAADYATRPMAAHMAPLVGQGTVRAAAVGLDDRRADQAAVDRMAAFVGEAMDQGCYGLSTGLVYPPGSFATTAELVEIAAPVAGRGLYVSHVRNEMDGVVDAITEALEIGAGARTAVHVSHLKAAGPANHGTMPQLLELLAATDSASADVYPYTEGSTVLHALLPPWATTGGVQAMLDRLGQGTVRERLRAEFTDPLPGWQNFLDGIGWDDVRIATAAGQPQLEGRTIADIALQRGADPIDVVSEIVRTTKAATTIIVPMAHPHDMRKALAWSRTTVGSDGIPVPGKPHPRWAGSFARALRLARDEGLLPLAEVVEKITSLPARLFGLGGRGRLAVGAAADVVVFDPETVEEGATFDDPLARPAGVDHVFVGGRAVILGGEDTGDRPGTVLPRTA